MSGVNYETKNTLGEIMQEALVEIATQYDESFGVSESYGGVVHTGSTVPGQDRCV